MNLLSHYERRQKNFDLLINKFLIIIFLCAGYLYSKLYLRSFLNKQSPDTSFELEVKSLNILLWIMKLMTNILINNRSIITLASNYQQL